MKEFINQKIKTEINISQIFNIVLGFICGIGLCFFLVRFLIRREFALGFSDIILTFLLIVFILLPFYIFKDFKIFIISDTQSQSLHYYSLFRPFGKTICFKDYIGTYQTTESGTSGSYKVLYLLDKNNITRLKIMGLYYKNMDEIIEAIPLPQIKRNLSGKEYFNLMFTGRANLSKIKDKKNTDDKTIGYLKIFIAISFIIFILGMISRIISKIN